MLKKRIIPCLDIKDGKVVKGVNFVNFVNVGDPAEVAKGYENQGADEVVLLDITASLEERDTVYDVIKRASSKLTIPFAVGGGIGTIEDFRKILSCGASKVSINTAAVKTPELILKASEEFGKECVVVAIDAKKVGDGYNVFIKGGLEDTGIDLIEWAKKCEALGAGEILLTSIDGDGMQNGYDIEMTKAVVKSVNIPVIASGGCGKISDIIDVFKKTDCDAALVASLFHFDKATVNDVKLEMKRNNIPCKL